MNLFRHLAALTVAIVVTAGAQALAQGQPPIVAEPGIAQPPIAQPGPPPVVPPALPQPQVVAPPPLPVAPPPTVYFVEQNGQPGGPFTLDDLKARITAGTLKGDTLVWKQGAPAWAAAKEVAEVAALLPVAPPPVPAGEQYKRLLIGTWQVQQASNLGYTTNSTYTYNADGTYNGVVIQSFQGMSIPQPDSGTWSVQAVSTGTFSLTMNQGGQGLGGLPGTGALIPLTAVMRVVDQNTLANDAAGYQARRIR